MSSRNFSWILLFLSASCSISGPLRDDEKAKNYSYKKPSATQWKEFTSQSGADKSFVSEQSGAVMAVNSLCKRYNEADLQDLAKQLWTPLRNPHLVSEERKTISDREALWQRVSGTVDGVVVEAVFVIVRKNRCFFDFALMSLGSATSSDLEDFNGVVNSFDFQNMAGKRGVAEKK